MKIKKIDTSKSIEALNELKQKSVEIGKKTAENVQQSTQNLIDKRKNEAYLKRLKDYNPLFPEVYQSEEYHIPNVIRIVDDAERRDIDVCEGSIGWTEKVKSGKNKELEILCLYDEAVNFSGLTFIPADVCGSLYVVDNFDKNIYVQVNEVIERATKEKLAELENIVYALGAKRCTVKISKTTKSNNLLKKVTQNEQGASVAGSLKESASQGASSSKSSVQKGYLEINSPGHDNPQRPSLKWFKNDNSITNLIEARINNLNAVTSKTLLLSGSSVSTMTQDMACSIDAAAKKYAGAKFKASGSMEKKVTEEQTSNFEFYIEF